MKYERVIGGIFISRPNRFIAHVLIEGTECICHVKNTGRCRELLIPGVQVILAVSDNPARKTAYDLIAVYKGDRLINIDSQAPNRVAQEYLKTVYPQAHIRREVAFGKSRLDICIEDSSATVFAEVKGVTLEFNNIAYFPDAPTQRGVKHLHSLIQAVEQGYKAMLLFVVQIDGISRVHPNEHTHPQFGQTLRLAKAAGVELRAITCLVTPDELKPLHTIPVCTKDDRP